MTNEERATLCAADEQRGWASLDEAAQRSMPRRILDKLLEYRGVVAGLIPQAASIFRSDRRSLLNYVPAEPHQRMPITVVKPAPRALTFKERLAIQERAIQADREKEFAKASCFREVRDEHGKVVRIEIDREAQKCLEDAQSNRMFEIARGDAGVLYAGISDCTR